MSNIKHAGNLEGYAVLVTGGGTGIGDACAAELAADGAQVTICGRRQEVLDEAAEKIAARAAFGGGVHTVTGDVTSEEDVQAIVAKALEPTGKLNGCIANAGGGGIPFWTAAALNGRRQCVDNASSTRTHSRGRT